MDKKGVDELRSFSKPPLSVLNIVKAAYLLTLTSKYVTPKKSDQNQEYTEFKKVLTVEKITALNVTDIAHLDSSNMTLVHEIMDQYPDNSSISKVSIVAAELHKIVAKILESYNKSHEGKAKPVTKVVEEKKGEEEKHAATDAKAVKKSGAKDSGKHVDKVDKKKVDVKKTEKKVEVKVEKKVEAKTEKKVSPVPKPKEEKKEVKKVVAATKPAKVVSKK